jgi:hypothetical protein
LDALWMEAPHVELRKIRAECCARLALRDPFSERNADAGACLDSERVETRGNPEHPANVTECVCVLKGGTGREREGERRSRQLLCT